MKELIPIFIASLVLSYLSERNSKYDYNRECYIYKDKIFMVCLAFGLILFAGLRTAYNDTTTYTWAYDVTDVNESVITSIDWRIGSNPGFELTNYILKLIGFSTQSFLLFYAVITIGIYIWFIRKYTNSIWLSVFLFFTIGGYVFTLAAIKQCVAVAFCLIATDRAINKKYYQFLIFVGIAITFHPYAFMYLVVPFLMFRPFSGKTYVMIGVFLLIGFSLQNLLGSLVSATLIIGEGYGTESFMGEGVNPLRLAVVAVPSLMAFFSRDVINSRDENVSNLMVNLTMLNAEIMFIALFGTANYFARLANYFVVFQTISIPWLFTNFNYKSRKLLIVIAVICYLVFFYYENAIKDSFDLHFYNISLRNYLMSLF